MVLAAIVVAHDGAVMAAGTGAADRAGRMVGWEAGPSVTARGPGAEVEADVLAALGIGAAALVEEDLSALADLVVLRDRVGRRD